MTTQATVDTLMGRLITSGSYARHISALRRRQDRLPSAVDMAAIEAMETVDALRKTMRSAEFCVAAAECAGLARTKGEPAVELIDAAIEALQGLRERCGRGAA